MWGLGLRVEGFLGIEVGAEGLGCRDELGRGARPKVEGLFGLKGLVGSLGVGSRDLGVHG